MKKVIILAVCLIFGIIILAKIGFTSNNNGPEKLDENIQNSTIKQEPRIEIISENVMKFISSIGNTEAIYLAELKNVGNTALRFDSISIDLEDIEGSILDSSKYVSSYPDSLNVGETAYICEKLLSFNSNVSLENIGKATLHYDLKKKSNIEVPNVEITEAKLTTEYNYPKIIGRIQNNSDKELENLYVSCPIFNENSQLVTVIFTIIDNLKPGEKKGFDQMAIYANPQIDYSNCTFKITPYLYSIF